jgi:hypothetical protein
MDSDPWMSFGTGVFGGVGWLDHRAGYRTGEQAVRHFLVMFLCAAFGWLAVEVVTSRFGYAWGVQRMAELWRQLGVQSSPWRRTHDFACYADVDGA